MQVETIAEVSEDKMEHHHDVSHPLHTSAHTHTSTHAHAHYSPLADHHHTPQLTARHAPRTARHTSQVFWHANIYRWEVVEEDALGNKDNDLYGPMQVPIEGPRKGAHKGYRSEIKAMLAAEAACKLRDASPGETPGPKTIKAEEVLATHFRVLIVSKAFVGRSYVQHLPTTNRPLVQPTNRQPSTRHLPTTNFTPPTPSPLITYALNGQPYLIPI
jgi:stress-induced morphogen